jgi:hypothetical protein
LLKSLLKKLGEFSRVDIPGMDGSGYVFHASIIASGLAAVSYEMT